MTENDDMTPSADWNLVRTVTSHGERLREFERRITTNESELRSMRDKMSDMPALIEKVNNLVLQVASIVSDLRTLGNQSSQSRRNDWDRFLQVTSFIVMTVIALASLGIAFIKAGGRP